MTRTAVPSTGAALGDEPDGAVRIQCLREGSGPTLFVIPGLDGDPDELAELTSRFSGPQRVVAVVPELIDTSGQPVTTVERMADLVVDALSALAPSGPYALAGYSFGALVALEGARRCRAAGRDVDALFLIEPVYGERFWPRRIRATATVRRTTGHLRRIARMRPIPAFVEVRRRAVRLLRRVAGDHDALASEVAESTPMGRRARLALNAYRPRPYDGPLTLITGVDGGSFGCDVAALWRPYLDPVDVRHVPGDHLTIIRDRASVSAVAHLIDRRLARRGPGAPGLRPQPGFERPLIVTTMRWFSAARLAQALSDAGFRVSTCRPARHPLGLVDGLVADQRLNRLWPLRSVAKAVRRADPDVVLCDDERSLELLRRLYVRVQADDPKLAAVLSRSLGPPEDWPVLRSRASVLQQAGALGLPAPETVAVGSLTELDAWAEGSDPPWVLKTDGSWGGGGVATAYDRSQLRDAWRALDRGPGVLRIAKRLLIDRDAKLLVARCRGIRPAINAQRYCPGQDAIATVACVDGHLESIVCLAVVHSSDLRGPAAVVRQIDDANMADAVRGFVRRYRLTGFYGFDFRLSADGRALAVEVNLRVTPTCHLLVEGNPRDGRPIVLFPVDVADVESPEDLGVIDVPWSAPRLLARGLALGRRQHRPLARLTRRLGRRARERAALS